MKAIRPDKRHVLSTREAMAEVDVREPGYAGEVIQYDEEAGLWRLPDVSHRGDMYEVCWTESLLENGAALLQDTWIARTKDEEWKVAPATFYGSTVMILYENRNHPDADQQAWVHVFKDVLNEDLEQFVMTSTQLVSGPGATNRILHGAGYGLTESESLGLYDHWQVMDDRMATALFGNPGILDAYQWLVGEKDMGVFNNCGSGSKAPLVMNAMHSMECNFNSEVELAGVVRGWKARKK
ncbi:hypothetical protein ACFL0V_01370 [Nanoarchaeota archaeon]